MLIRWGGTGGDINLPWAENCDLDGTRVASDDVLLDWCQFEPDEQTLGLWHLNEAGWDGTPGEVVDSSGNGHHGTAANGADTVPGWLDRAGSFSAPLQTAVEIPYSAALNPDWFTVEFWVKWNGTAADYQTPMSSRDGAAKLGWIMYVENSNTWVFWHGTGSAWIRTVAAVSPISNQWQHVAVYLQVLAAVSIYINGALVGQRGSSLYHVNTSKPTYLGAGYIGGYHWNGLVDEVRLSSGQRYSGPFSPTRYPEAGTVTARYGPMTEQRLSQIAWNGTFGPDTGRLRRLWVYSGGDWQQVGGDYPTSPITGLELPVTGPDLVRVELEPKADALQSETPTLDWLEVGLETAYVPKPPFRAGAVAAATTRAENVTAAVLRAGTVTARQVRAEFDE